MEPRLDAFNSPVASKLVRQLAAANAAMNGVVPATTLELIRIRASQINGCAFCLDMHTKEAEAAGETAQRLNLVATWREATVFTPEERAALELTEAGTRLPDGGSVTDDTWALGAKYYDEEQLAAIVGQIALINAFNRLNVMTAQPGGSYVVGMFG